MRARASYSPEGLFDNKPVVTDRRLQPYVDGVIGAVNKQFEEMYGVVPDYTQAEISVKKQPSIYVIFRKGGKWVGQKIGQIFGRFYPGRNKIEIDPSVVDGKAPVSLNRVLGEELVHYVQDKFGSIARYAEKFGKDARDYVEGAAATWADRLFGKTDIYPREKELYRNYERKAGPKNAFLGA